MAGRKSANPSPAAPVLDHRDGCPAERTESYNTPSPRDGEVTVTRCLDCGAQTISTTVQLEPAAAEAAVVEPTPTPEPVPVAEEAPA